MNDEEKQRIDAGLKALESSGAKNQKLLKADGTLEFELIKMAQGSGHNKYCVIDYTKFLGKGMEANVYMAHFVEKRRMSKTKQPWDYKDAAVKIFNQDPSSTAEFTIAPRYLPGSERINIDNRTLFLMPYQPGQNLLEKYIEPGTILASLNFEDRVNVAAQLMDECHRHASNTATTGGSIIHGDIKGENIKIWRKTTSSPINKGNPIKVKIVDYGTAVETTTPNELTDVETDDKAIGSSFFMSPEASSKQLATASDLYSCVPILAITLGASSTEVFENKEKNFKGFMFSPGETNKRNLDAFTRATYNVSGIMPGQDESLRQVAIAFLNRMQEFNAADRPDNNECLHFFKTLERIALYNSAHPDQKIAEQSGLLFKLQLLSEGNWQSGLQNYAFDNGSINNAITCLATKNLLSPNISQQLGKDDSQANHIAKALTALDNNGLLNASTIQWLSNNDNKKAQYTAIAIQRLDVIGELTREKLDVLIDDNNRHSHVARALVKLHRPPVRALTATVADSVFDKAASIAEAGDFTKAYEALTAEIRTQASPRRTRGRSMPADKYPGPARVRTPTKKTHHKYPGPARQRGSKKPPPPLPPFRRRPTD